MKKLLIGLLLSLPVAAQAANRPVIVSWTASASSTVTGYNVYACAVPTGQLGCTPQLATPVGMVSGTSFTLQEPVGSAIGVSVVALAPPCTMSSSLTGPCGNADPTTVTYIPVPPRTTGSGPITIIMP